MKKIIVGCLVAVIILGRFTTVDDGLYLRIFSKDTFFNIRKHTAPKEILREFKDKKAEGFPLDFDYLAETEDSLLYKNSCDGLYIMTLKDGKVETSHYEPNLSYSIDGDYLKVSLEDKFDYLYLVDEIILSLDYDGLDGKSLWTFPVSTHLQEFDGVIFVKGLSELDQSKFSVTIYHISGGKNKWKW